MFPRPGESDVQAIPRLRPKLALLLGATAAAVLLLTGAAVASGTYQSETQALDAGVFAQLNHIRTDHHLAPLELDAKLSAAADEHSHEMVVKGYFAHASSNGAPFWKRIEAYYPLKAYQRWSVGENLLWRPGSVNATAVLEAWMASPGHRANILSSAWRQIGISAVTAPDAPGTFAGLDITVITTDFGARG